MLKKEKNFIFIFGFIIFIAICFFNISSVKAAINWWPLPPYNTLWPLWSPVLSPANAIGIPQPVVSSLTPDTVLPVQPGLTSIPVNENSEYLAACRRGQFSASTMYDKIYI